MNFKYLFKNLIFFNLDFPMAPFSIKILFITSFSDTFSLSYKLMVNLFLLIFFFISVIYEFKFINNILVDEFILYFF